MKSAKPVGENVKRARQQAGLTQVELGKRLGVTGAAISRLEIGNRGIGIDTLKRLAEILDVDVSTLYGSDERHNGPDVMKWLEQEFSHDVAVKICKGEATAHEWGIIEEMYERIKGGNNAE